MEASGAPHALHCPGLGVSGVVPSLCTAQPPSKCKICLLSPKLPPSCVGLEGHQGEVPAAACLSGPTATGTLGTGTARAGLSGTSAIGSPGTWIPETGTPGIGTPRIEMAGRRTPGAQTLGIGTADGGTKGPGARGAGLRQAGCPAATRGWQQPEVPRTRQPNPRHGCCTQQPVTTATSASWCSHPELQTTSG